MNYGSNMNYVVDGLGYARIRLRDNIDDYLNIIK